MGMTGTLPSDATETGATASSMLKRPIMRDLRQPRKDALLREWMQTP
eukprot:CAMPEP_0174726972 /NCGR_PEP_ID=MMETSP1094-20130205/48823_1 /TAXON_ID=156173 /ORGANISM="Chrysochromulina brevifilum, Strain UTEX LB 985" /LENGTH=46 /DNA_ID= /DNA_START= /DNA_END= /DNA_ORIENTATION=